MLKILNGLKLLTGTADCITKNSCFFYGKGTHMESESRWQKNPGSFSIC
jgi:hypothetical protein